MNNETKILVPIDFTPCSDNALAYAFRMARNLNAILHILHVPIFKSGDIGNNPATVTLAIQERTQNARNELTKTIKKVYQSVLEEQDTFDMPSLRTNIQMGNVQDTIRDEAGYLEADLIIMGTQGQNSTMDKYLGSVASNVLKNAPCPVMVVPNSSTYKPNADIAFATDIEQFSAEDLLNNIKFIRPGASTVKCVHFHAIQEDSRKKMTEIAAHFKEHGPEINAEFYSIESADLVASMNDFLVDNRIGLLVMFKPKKGFFESLFGRSYTEEMAKHTNIPLLILK